MATNFIKWVDSVTPNILHHLVYRDDILIATVPNGVQEYHDTSAVSGTKYKYEIQVEDSKETTTKELIGVNTDYYNTVAADAPMIGELTHKDVTHSSVILNCTANDDVVVTHFFIYVNGANFVTANVPNLTDYVLTGLEEDTNYRIYVTALDIDGNESTPSEIVTFDTLLRLDVLNSYNFVAEGAVYSAGVLQVQKPNDRLGDFTVTRNSVKTRVNEQLIVEEIAANVPSIDYTNGVAELLLEPESTNLYLKSSGTITENTTVTATKYTVSFYGLGTLTFSGAYTGTLVGTAANERVKVTFTPSTGTLTSTISGTIEDKQIENLSYATSVIRTSGATETRLADVISNGANANVINSEEGTMIIEMSALNSTPPLMQIMLNDGTYEEAIELRITENSFDMWIRDEHSPSSITSKNTDVSLLTKIALKFKSNDFALWLNGIEDSSSSRTTEILGMNKFSLSSPDGKSYITYGRIRKMSIYTEALTDEELQILTSTN